MSLKTILTSCTLFLAVGLADAQVVPVYGTVEKADFQQASEAFKRVRLLEQIANGVNRTIRIPSRITLVARECGVVNAFYSPKDHSVHLCYELLEQVVTGIAREFGSASSEAKMDSAFGAVFFILYHEMGHALVDTLRLPVLGKEEDVADAIATYFMLRSREPYPVVLGSLWFFGQGSHEFTLRQYADEHPVGPQRQYNLLCYAVGKDKARFGPLSERFFLPPERAARCPTEYRNLETSVQQLLGSYIRR